MGFRRTLLEAFQLANDAYVNATITFFKADPETGANTEVLATLYEAYSGTDVLTNPIQLDSDGKFATNVYIEDPVIGVISESTVDNHTTGVIFPTSSQWRGTWETDQSYLPGDVVIDGVNGANTGNYYVATAAHTSDVWADDLSANKMQVFLEVGDVTAAKNDAEAAATAAAGSATAAASSASSASSSATAASNSASAAATSESNASTSESNAAASETAAAASAASLNIPAPIGGKTGAFIVQNGSDDGFTRLPQGDSGQILTSAGDDTNPAWGKTIKELEADALIISGVM